MIAQARKRYIQNNCFPIERGSGSNMPENFKTCTSILKKRPDVELQKSWSGMEKETLKKYLLQFGYGRWQKIRNYSENHDKILMMKGDSEMKAFSNDFIRTLFDYLQQDKSDLKHFLINLIDEE